MIELGNFSKSCSFGADLLERLVGGWSGVLIRLREIGVGTICDLDGLEVSLLDDSDMSRVHLEFLGDDSTTDVITFDHGELLIGVEVAERQAAAYGSSGLREIALYGIHGMLHLAGFDDRSAADSRKMSQRQEELLEEFFEWLK
ncbi:MAG: rRNA maturation RNase YbeY [Verrucomicrobiaceae bacterium]